MFHFTFFQTEDAGDKINQVDRDAVKNGIVELMLKSPCADGWAGRSWVIVGRG